MRSASALKSHVKLLMLLCITLWQPLQMAAQTKELSQKSKEAAAAPRPTEVKILDEHKDASGNTVRTIQYYQNGMRIVEKVIVPLGIGMRVPINPDTLNKDSVLIIVNKSKYVVDVYYRRKKIRSYKAVFGPKPLENKTMEGDRCTPEGWFAIQNKNPNSKYDKFMLLSYPDTSAVRRFNAMKASGKIPASARIGGDVGIHGIWKGGDDMIEMGVCWTDGCIAIKNKDIEDLYTLAGVGTRVYIRK